MKDLQSSFSSFMRCYALSLRHSMKAIGNLCFQGKMGKFGFSSRIPICKQEGTLSTDYVVRIYTDFIRKNPLILN